MERAQLARADSILVVSRMRRAAEEGRRLRSRAVQLCREIKTIRDALAVELERARAVARHQSEAT